MTGKKSDVVVIKIVSCLFKLLAGLLSTCTLRSRSGDFERINKFIKILTRRVDNLRVGKIDHNTLQY